MMFRSSSSGPVGNQTAAAGVYSGIVLLESSNMSQAIIFLFALLMATPIVRRTDVADERYLALGQRYPSVVSLGRAGDATLIAPGWLITAAHVARAVDRAGVRSIHIGSADVPIGRVVLHPDWHDHGEHDIALIQLEAPVTMISPAGLYRGSSEQGQIAALIGHGGSGKGSDRQREDDGHRRGATSQVDSVSATGLFFSFDAPPNGTELEGAPGPGDSGGPAMLTVDGASQVAGISSAGFDGRNGPGSYGAIDVFTRVSTHLAWIDRVMSTPGAVAPVTQTIDTALSATTAGRHFGAFLHAVRVGTDSAIATFVHTHFEKSEYQSRPALIPNLRRIAAQLRGATIDSVVPSTDLQMTVRFRTTTGVLTLELICSPVGPHKLVDWRRY